MTAKKATKATKKSSSKKTEKPSEQKIGGRFRPGSDLARMYEMLLPGKALSVDQIQAVVKAGVKGNIAAGKYASLSAFGRSSGLFTMQKIEENGVMKIQMVASATKTKTA